MSGPCSRSASDEAPLLAKALFLRTLEGRQTFQWPRQRFSRVPGIVNLSEAINKPRLDTGGVDDDGGPSLIAIRVRVRRSDRNTPSLIKFPNRTCLEG